MAQVHTLNRHLVQQVGYLTPVSKKSVHLSEILFGSLFVGAFGLAVYWLCERLGIVPIITLKESDTFALAIIGISKFSLNYGELVISMLIIVEITWTTAWILWFKLRKYEIVW